MEKFIISFTDIDGNPVIFYDKDKTRNWIETYSSEEVNKLTKQIFEESDAIYAIVFVIDENNVVKKQFKILKYQESFIEEMKQNVY